MLPVALVVVVDGKVVVVRGASASAGGAADGSSVDAVKVPIGSVVSRGGCGSQASAVAQLSPEYPASQWWAVVVAVLPMVGWR